MGISHFEAKCNGNFRGNGIKDSKEVAKIWTVAAWRLLQFEVDVW